MTLRDKVPAVMNGGENSATSARTRHRDVAMNWIALGVLLGAWHMEARLDRGLGVPMNAHVANPSTGWGTQPLWSAGSRARSWISRASASPIAMSARHVVPPAAVYTPVATLRMIRRWLPGI